ncbi:MAG TPA: Zn-ribbon domain-containing OB-fold protein [Dehalococcoidia bacterium]|nr:Zn-ribbon domain-containing OB-fold protein [Dehalococcoidia bacterium]
MTTQPAYAKPLPLITPENERFWQGCKAHELWLRFCNACAKPYYYPRDICPMCGSRDVSWQQMSGRGTLHTFAIVHRAPTPAFREDVPFVTAMVDLEEGPRLLTNLVGIAPDPAQIRVGMPVEVTFEDVTEQISLPKFRPVG